MPVESDSSSTAACESRLDTTTLTRLRKPAVSGGVVMHVILASLGLCGVVIVLLCTHRYGPAVSADVDNYFAAARSLLAGEGYRSYRGTAYTQWAPLFPTLLAALGLAGVEPSAGARWINALAFGSIVLLSGQLFMRCTTSRALVIVGTLSVLASRSLLDGSVLAMSEPVFIVLALLLALCLPRLLRRGDLSSLILVSILAGLACLQRYAGVSLVLAVSILIGWGMSGTRLAQRIRYVVIFGVVSVIPLALWCIRNRMFAGETAGGHHFHLMTGAEVVASLRTAVRTASLWLFPWAPDRWGQPIGLGWVVALAGAAIVLSRVVRARRIRSASEMPRDSDWDKTYKLQMASVLVIGAIYFSFMVVCGAALDWHPERRHMMLLCPFFMAFMVAAVAGAGQLLRLRFGRPALIGTVGIVLCSLWLQYPLRVLYRNTIRRMTDGAGGYATSAWQNSPLIQWLRDHPLPGQTYTNSPDGVYLLTRAVDMWTPLWREENSLTELARGSTSQARYIVWFHHLYRSWLYDLREILSCCRTEEVATFPDGCVLRCLGESGPGLSGFYRFWSPRTARHFYTIDKRERERLRILFDGTWVDEDAIFYAFRESQPGTRPVYRFWSERQAAQLYTMSESEKGKLTNSLSDTWACQGIAFYAYPEKSKQECSPVYRLLSRESGDYLYTTNERERKKLVEGGKGGWIDEGIAWYAYGL